MVGKKPHYSIKLYVKQISCWNICGDRFYSLNNSFKDNNLLGFVSSQIKNPGLV